MIKNPGFLIKKSSSELIMLVSLFIFSFINSASLLVFLVAISFLFLQKQVGALKIMFVLTLRTVINPGIAVEFGSLQTLKLGLLILASLYLLLSATKTNRFKLSRVFFSLGVFVVYNIFIAFYSSSLPIVSIFKLLLFAVVYAGIISGVSDTIERFDIFNWILKWLKLIMIGSLFSYLSPISYLMNGTGFQGLLNQPNMFGIVTVLFIAMLLGHEKKKGNIFFFVSALFMLITSDSRTSLISIVVVLLLFFLDRSKIKITKSKVMIFSFSAALLLLFYNSIADNITEFLVSYIAKGQTLDNVLYSRQGQVNSLLYNFQQRPLLGNGFSVPVLPFRSYGLSLDYTVEPGNIILAVLSFSGIIGFLIFIWHLSEVLVFNKYNLRNKIYLFVSVFMINLGEMVFFSSNNIGIFCYFMLAMYMFYKPESKEKDTQLMQTAR
ncbi:O-antigen ligase family protein [Enterococcus faecium]|uniref:O-antigen ligase family protein n=1 Tax=Enterococcus faecium TaxID=1352 RepID=UPI0024BB8B12|nr:O-antigen ligase family protein [Enterococcus faecium]